MKMISDILFSNGLEKINRKKLYFRKTARAVIFSKNFEKILMLFSEKHNDYTFPGGGLDKGEVYKEALQRELKEEIGLIEFEILKPCGQILEVRKSMSNPKFIYKQLSKYFIVSANKFGKRNLQPNEKKMGLHTVWIDPKEAYLYNLNSIENSKENRVCLRRENVILKKIIDNKEEFLGQCVLENLK